MYVVIDNYMLRSETVDLNGPAVVRNQRKPDSGEVDGVLSVLDSSGHYIIVRCLFLLINSYFEPNIRRGNFIFLIKPNYSGGFRVVVFVVQHYE